MTSDIYLPVVVVIDASLSEHRSLSVLSLFLFCNPQVMLTDNVALELQELNKYEEATLFVVITDNQVKIKKPERHAYLFYDSRLQFVCDRFPSYILRKKR